MLENIKNSPVLILGILVLIIGVIISLWAHFGGGEKKHLYLGVGLAVGGGIVAFGSQYMPNLFPPPDNGEPPVNGETATALITARSGATPE